MLDTIATIFGWLLVLLALAIVALVVLWLCLALPALLNPEPEYYKSAAIKAKAWKRLAEYRKRQSKARKRKKNLKTTVRDKKV